MKQEIESLKKVRDILQQQYEKSFFSVDGDTKLKYYVTLRELENRIKQVEEKLNAKTKDSVIRSR